MSLSLDDIRNLVGNRLGVHDVACPECGPQCKSPVNRKRRVLRVWWEEAGFARFKCARCDLQGHAREGQAPRQDAPRPLPARHDPPDDADRTDRAIAIWKETVPLVGTPAQPYLASRGVPYDGHALRWHPSCPFGKGVRVGCMIGLVRNIITNAPHAIHRTAIGADGSKLNHLGSNGRLTYGPIGGGAIKLTPDEDVTTVIAIGEGIETTLSIRRLPDLEAMPVWSVLAANQLAAFPLLPSVACLWIGVDNDESGTGQRAADEATNRWAAARREVFRVKPKRIGADLNDLEAAHGKAA